MDEDRRGGQALLEATITCKGYEGLQQAKRNECNRGKSCSKDRLIVCGNYKSCDRTGAMWRGALTSLVVRWEASSCPEKRHSVIQPGPKNDDGRVVA